MEYDSENRDNIHAMPGWLVAGRPSKPKRVFVEGQPTQSEDGVSVRTSVPAEIVHEGDALRVLVGEETDEHGAWQLLRESEAVLMARHGVCVLVDFGTAVNASVLRQVDSVHLLKKEI